MALTGFIEHNTCYGTKAAAVDAHFSAIPATILANGNTVFYQYNLLTLVWQRVQITPANLITYTVAPVPSFQLCDPLAGFNDGLALAALVSGALIMATVWGIMARHK